MDEDKKVQTNEENDILTDSENLQARVVTGTTIFHFPKKWKQTLRHKLPEPMELLAHLEETAEGKIILVAELKRK